MVRPEVSDPKAPLAVALVSVAATVGILPFAAHQLGATVSFVPALLSVVACFDVLSVYLLLGDYRDKGDPRMLAMVGAYLWSLVLMAGYSLAFPGVFSANPPLAFTPSVAPWLYLGWHAGFPLLLAAAWAPWPKSTQNMTAPELRRPLARAAMTFVVVLAIGVVIAIAALAHHLPVVIHGHDTTRMTELTAPVVMPLVGAAVITAWRGTRRRTGPERWTAVAVLVCLCDLTLTYTSRSRFSIGWYSGRAMTLTAAALVLLAMLVEFRQLKQRAEFNAAYDSLTGLANHRTTHDMLGRQFAGARRSAAPLAVLIIDLDLFKLVNDRYGHGAGDALLKDVGAALGTAVRAGDLVGRVGGEEFLAVLPNTDESGALAVAERMRRAIASTCVASGSAPTASIGAACLVVADGDSASLLRRADQALYRAKSNGRDRVVVASDPNAAEAIIAAGGVISQRGPSDLAGTR